MRQLVVVGWVRSIRGAKGGHVLARSPEKISVREIMPDKAGASKAFAYANNRVRKELCSYVSGFSLDEVARHA